MSWKERKGEKKCHFLLNFKTTLTRSTTCSVQRTALLVTSQPARLFLTWTLTFRNIVILRRKKFSPSLIRHVLRIPRLPSYGHSLQEMFAAVLEKEDCSESCSAKSAILIPKLQRRLFLWFLNTADGTIWFILQSILLHGKRPLRLSRRSCLKIPRTLRQTSLLRCLESGCPARELQAYKQEKPRGRLHTTSVCRLRIITVCLSLCVSIQMSLR